MARAGAGGARSRSSGTGAWTAAKGSTAPPPKGSMGAAGIASPSEAKPSANGSAGGGAGGRAPAGWPWVGAVAVGIHGTALNAGPVVR